METQFRIGHTGITWGYDPLHIGEAVRDVAALGYQGFETFGDTIEAYNRQHPEGFGALLQEQGLPLASVFCPVWAIEPGAAQQSIGEVVRWAGLARDLGASTIVIQGGRRGSGPFTNYPWLVNVFNEIGSRLADMGLAAALHPHTGTVVETRAEIDRVLAAVDPRLVGFAPDTGHLSKGGSEVLPVLEEYRAIIQHVHLKDYRAGPGQVDPEGNEIDPTGYSGYLPLGKGLVDFPRVLRLLESTGYDRWVMVELNPPTRPVALPPRAAAQASKNYLQNTLGLHISPA